jgi:two-component system, chemotaxis family, protein-glutamate methylesterase/glutaminase
VTGPGEGARAAAQVPRPRLPIGIGIGASAGGPRALLALLAEIALPPSVYAFLVQHIHPKFTGILERRLNEVARCPVRVAAAGAIEPGTLYVAPAGRHLVVEREWPATFRVRLSDDPAQHGVRPSVDALFQSLAAAFAARAIGVVLTGMGRDGLAGARAIKARGGTVLAEAESSCLIYGMPRALAEAEVVDRLVPLPEMAGAIGEAIAATAALPPRSAARSR